MCYISLKLKKWAKWNAFRGGLSLSGFKAGALSLPLPLLPCASPLQLPASVRCACVPTRLKAVTFCSVTLVRPLVLCSSLVPLLFNYRADAIAEWSGELWLRFRLCTLVSWPRANRTVMFLVAKTNGVSLPVVHQLLKVMSYIYYSHLNHHFLE